MNIVITGASGFLGEACLNQATNIDFSNIFAVTRSSTLVRKIKNFNVVNQLDDLCGINKVDLLIHTAAATPNNSPPNAIKNLNILIDGKLSSFIKSNFIAHVVYISSMSDYGNIKDPIINEFTVPDNPSEYGKSKLLGEQSVGLACRKSSSRFTVLRSPGIVGLNMSTVFFKRCFEQIKKGFIVEIPSEDSLFNNAIFVDDIFLTCLNAFHSQMTDTAVVNLHSKDILLLTTFIDNIASSIGIPAEIIINSSLPHSFIISNEKTGYILKTRNLHEIIKSFSDQNLQ